MNKKAEEYLMNANMGLFEFNPNYYAQLLRDDIWGDVQYALWNFREQESSKFASTYGMCNHIMTVAEKAIKKS